MARGETMTPTPEGVITTTEILQPVQEVVVEEEVKEEEWSAIYVGQAVSWIDWSVQACYYYAQEM